MERQCHVQLAPTAFALDLTEQIPPERAQPRQILRQRRLEGDASSSPGGGDTVVVSFNAKVRPQRYVGVG